MTDKLKQTVETALEVLAKVKYGLERNRVWGGMGWSYVPIHPTQYLPLVDDLEKQMSALHRAIAEPDNHIAELRTRLQQMRDLQEYGEVGIASEERIAGYNAAVDEVLEHLRDMGLDTGTDRGAWSDVENATKWVDELRGGEAT